MKPDISEFSYGFALTHELVDSIPGITIAPVFPSLIQEGRVGGGWDVRIESPSDLLFIQFKLSDYMVRPTAWESLQGIVQVPFYRVHLRPSRHSVQHQLLLTLEQSEPNTFYAAPRFYNAQQLNDAFTSRQTAVRSLWIRPSDIGPLPDGDDHHIAIGEDSDEGFFCSKPRRLSGTFHFDALAEQIQRQLRSQSTRARSVDRISDALEAMFSIVSSVGRDVSLIANTIRQSDMWNQMDTLSRLAYVARGVFNLQVYAVSESAP